MAIRMCPECDRSIEPLVRWEKDKKTKKTWMITYCPYDRCGFNLDLEPSTVQVWNNEKCKFEDLT